MIKNDTNNFFNDQETQDPLIREKLLFKDIGLKLKKITEKSVGWKNRLNKINFEKINTREDFNNIPMALILRIQKSMHICLLLQGQFMSQEKKVTFGICQVVYMQQD